jgi:hypothetical protein
MKISITNSILKKIKLYCGVNRNFFLLTVFLALLILAACLFMLLPKGQSIPVEGGCSDVSSPYMHKHFNDGRRITYCAGGDGYRGWVKSSEFIGRKGSIQFEYAGYPKTEGIQLSLVSNNEEKRIKIDLPSAGENWRVYSIKTPEEFFDKKLFLFAEDTSVSGFGWIGMGLVKNGVINVGTEFILKVVIITVILFALLGSFLAFFISKFELDQAIAICFVLFGLYGYLTFFGYYMGRYIGVFSSITFIFCGCLSLIWIYRFKKFEEFKRALSFLLPVGLLTVFIILVGYHPFNPFDNNSAWQIPANKWLNLPIDNWLPKVFADQVWSGGVNRPMIGDWLSSDRPPLQAGIFLIFYPMMPGSAALYQTISTFLQLLILPVTWIFISMLGEFKNRVYLIFILAFSSLVLVNSLFVWPKLISATYLMLCFIFLWHEQASKIRNFIIGASAALAILSHGGAFFGLLGIFLVWGCVIARSKLTPKIFNDFFTWGMVGILIFLPWFLYGKYIDPENGRLMKWHLAGLVGPSDVTFLEAFLSAYGKLSLGEWFKGRLDNLFFIFDGSVLLDTLKSPPGSLIGSFRTNSFFHFFYSMWFFSPIIAVLVWAVNGFKKIPRTLLILILTTFFGIFLWSILMFLPGSTGIHQGSYFLWVACFIWSALLIDLSSEKLYLLGIAFNSVFAFLIYFSNEFPVGFENDWVFGLSILLLFMGFIGSLINLNFHNPPRA